MTPTAGRRDRYTGDRERGRKLREDQDDVEDESQDPEDWE